MISVEEPDQSKGKLIDNAKSYVRITVANSKYCSNRCSNKRVDKIMIISSQNVWTYNHIMTV